MQTPRIITSLNRLTVGRKFAPSLGKPPKANTDVSAAAPPSTVENEVAKPVAEPESLNEPTENQSVNSLQQISEAIAIPNECDVSSTKSVAKRPTISPSIAAVNEGTFNATKKQKIVSNLRNISSSGAVDTTRETTNRQHYDQPDANKSQQLVRNKRSSVTRQDRSSSSKPVNTSSCVSKVKKNITNDKLRDIEVAAARSRPYTVLPNSFGDNRGYTMFTVYLQRLPPPVGLGMRLKNVEGKAVVRGFSIAPEISAEAAKSEATKQSLLSALAGNMYNNTTSISNSLDDDDNILGLDEDGNQIITNNSSMTVTNRQFALNPAYAAGVRVNDVIVSVNNVDARMANFDRIIRALVGNGASDTANPPTARTLQAAGDGLPPAVSKESSSTSMSTISIGNGLSAGSGTGTGVSMLPAAACLINGTGSRGMGIAAVDHIVCVRFARPNHHIDQDIVTV